VQFLWLATGQLGDVKRGWFVTLLTSHVGTTGGRKRVELL